MKAEKELDPDITSAVNAGGISKVIRAKLTNILSGLHENSNDVIGSMVSSTDGFAWAQLLESGMDKHRFAAMSSTLLALSDNVIGEVSKGVTKNMIIESDSCNVFIMHAGDNLLLTIFSNATSSLGMLLAHATRTRDKILALKLENQNL